VRDRGTCVYCGAAYQSGAKLTVDHVVSRKRGGGDAFDNLVTACVACNLDKAHFSLGAYLFELADRGASKAHLEALTARVEAARKAPIVWPAVEAALALYRKQGKLPFDDAPDDD
jgi:HNH endonuclease